MELSPENPLTAEPETETSPVEEFVEQLRCVTDTLPSRINIDPQSVEQGLAKLVLTLIEFVRRLLEKQAVRRMEGGDLSPEQIEELGLALMRLEAKLEELKTQFGLADEDLDLAVPHPVRQDSNDGGGH
jgi:actin-like ATPase involved in cell morphogenesis